MVQKTIQLPANERHHRTKEEVELCATRLGEIALLSASAEAFNGYVQPIEAGSPFPATWCCGVVNGYSGYLPTYEAFHDGLGGYELNTTPYSDESAGIFLQQCTGLLTLLKERG
jgi:hypothetical protein